MSNKSYEFKFDKYTVKVHFCGTKTLNQIREEIISNALEEYIEKFINENS